MSYSKLLGRWFIVFTLLFSTGFLLGCKTAPPSNASFEPASSTNAVGGTDGSGLSDGGSTEIIHVGDSLVVTFSDLPTTIPAFEVRVNDEGTITLILNQKFTAAGKTRAQLENEIRERYVPRFYVRMTVTIKPQERMFYVDGEVHQPGPKMYIQPMTVLKAIASAGDFTDYAQKRRVVLTRLNGKKQTINCNKLREHPQLDLPVYPGDTIHVPRRIF